MLKLFCHINEFRERGWDMLPAMLLLADEIVLWAPSGAYLKQMYDSGNSPISPNDLLDLVESGVIRVAAREDWILDPKTRTNNSSWAGTHWFPEFDEKIRGIYLEDSRTGILDPRVIGADPERGYAWADSELGEDTKASRVARELVKKGPIPAATADRIEYYRGENPSLWRKAPVKMRARALLRDARNHEDARLLVGANLALHLAPFPTAAFNQIVDAPSIQPNQENIERSDVREFFSWISSLKYSSDVKTLLELRKDKAHRQQFWSLLTARHHPLAELKAQIQDGLNGSGFLEELYGTAPLQAIGLEGLAAGAVSAAVTRRWVCFAGVATATSIALGGAGMGYVAARRNSKIQDDDYAGPVWPFLLATGKPIPYRDEVLELVRHIADQLRSPNIF